MSNNIRYGALISCRKEVDLESLNSNSITTLIISFSKDSVIYKTMFAWYNPFTPEEDWLEGQKQVEKDHEKSGEKFSYVYYAEKGFYYSYLVITKPNEFATQAKTQEEYDDFVFQIYIENKTDHLIQSSFQGNSSSCYFEKD
jgi:hypothetical protein